MRIETRILGKLVFREYIDISDVKWIRSGLTNSGVYLELGVSNWKTIQLIWIPLTSNQVEFGRSTYQVMFDGIRTSVAQFLKIEDLGWARYA
jgi:predicted oxidoreductase